MDILTIMLYKYLNRKLEETENAVVSAKNACHWRSVTSDDYSSIMLAKCRQEAVASIADDLFEIIKLYRPP